MEGTKRITVVMCGTLDPASPRPLAPYYYRCTWRVT